MKITIDHVGRSLPASIRTNFTRNCIYKLQEKFGSNYSSAGEAKYFREAVSVIDQQIREARNLIDSSFAIDLYANDTSKKKRLSK